MSRIPNQAPRTRAILACTSFLAVSEFVVFVLNIYVLKHYPLLFNPVINRLYGFILIGSLFVASIISLFKISSATRDATTSSLSLLAYVYYVMVIVYGLLSAWWLLLTLWNE
jgi:hypothetical protein